MIHHDLLTAIGVSIIAAAVLALVARRVGQPLLLGYVLGGALLGPHIGFGLVTDEASIELISEIGLILLLFIIGLEMNLSRLLQAGRAIGVSGLLQFPLCAALGWFAFQGFAAGGRFDRLYLAVAFALSSTLIVVKLLFDKFEIATFTGRVTIGILVFQDLWAILFLAVQPNLDNLQAGPLLRSLLAGAGLVVGAAAMARYVLPALYRSIAKSTELVLLVSVAWCFLLSGLAGWAGLSKEMGSLIAGLVIAGFPYGAEVTARLGGVRDFFITLFFVALGLKIPQPSLGLLLVAVGATAFVVASRLIVLIPLFTALRVDFRSAAVVAINLSQVSEFSLVIVALGATYGHVRPDTSALVLFALLITAIVSTYGILFNHQIASALTRLAGAAGLSAWLAPPASPTAAAAEGEAHAQDVFLLGVSREGLAFVQHLERESPTMKARLVAIDFNPETLERLQLNGVHCHYGDISNVETLRHAGLDRARVVVSSISDWFLKGIDNRRLIRVVRTLAPNARVIATADTLAHAEALYAEGAAYVIVPTALAAEHLYELLRDLSDDALDRARANQARELFTRDRRAHPPVSTDGASH
ncbi:MAG: cation:proton antiporter [Candidatus Rokubacteria bacterium]|nr:cation:proton antiporter [Candidatus Rokubacteria bacterium]